MEELYTQLAALAQQYGAKRLVLFGSRARGDHHERSDIDLAVYGMPEQNRGAFWLEAEELPHAAQAGHRAYLVWNESQIFTQYRKGRCSPL